MSDIYITEEYEMFSFLRSNREVTLNKKLENSILQKGIIRPIIVNSTMQIIDGQHRYSIARKYGLPVPYYVSVNKEMNDIIKINNTACKWRVIDYINKYVILGNEEYKKLKDLHIENNKIPLVELVSVCMGSWTRQNKMMTEVKNGMFSFYNYEELKNLLNEYNDLKKNTQIKDAGAVFQAYFNLSSIMKYNQKWFIKKVNGLEISRKVLGIRQPEKVLKLFLETYNDNLKKNSNINHDMRYHLDLKHRAVIDDEINFKRVDPKKFKQ